jgi:hypothetical protein
MLHASFGHGPPASSTLQVKVAMLDSAHDSVAQLRAAAEECAADADDARRCVEEAEERAARQAAADAQEKAALRWVKTGAGHSLLPR